MQSNKIYANKGAQKYLPLRRTNIDENILL
jgi:hypothetical protein